MNALKNKVQLIGNLGMSPEVKELNGGKKLVKFSIATNETYRNAAGERVKETQWHNVTHVTFGTQALHTGHCPIQRSNRFKSPLLQAGEKVSVNLFSRAPRLFHGKRPVVLF